jgi:hypothetical protein
VAERDRRVRKVSNGDVVIGDVVMGDGRSVDGPLTKNSSIYLAAKAPS